MCRALHLDHIYPDVCMPHSLTSFGSLLKCHLLNLASPESSYSNCPLFNSSWSALFSL